MATSLTTDLAYLRQPMKFSLNNFLSYRKEVTIWIGRDSNQVCTFSLRAVMNAKQFTTFEA